MHDPLEALARERLGSGQARMQDTAERVDVGPGGETGSQGSAAELLGTHEAQRAHDRARDRERRRLDQLAQPEVGQPDVAVGVEQDVGGLDVAVDEAMTVGRIERLGDRPEELDRPRQGQRPFLGEHLGERRAVDEGKGQVEDPGFLAPVVERHDPRADQLHQRVSLAHEAVAIVRNPRRDRRRCTSARRAVPSGSSPLRRPCPCRRGQSGARSGTRRMSTRAVARSCCERCPAPDGHQGRRSGAGSASGSGSGTRRSRRAMAPASPRVETSILPRTFETWWAAVFSVMNNISAI